MPIELTRNANLKTKNEIIFPSRIIWRLAAFVNNNNCIHCSIFEDEFEEFFNFIYSNSNEIVNTRVHSGQVIHSKIPWINEYEIAGEKKADINLDLKIDLINYYYYRSSEENISLLWCGFSGNRILAFGTKIKTLFSIIIYWIAKSLCLCQLLFAIWQSVEMAKWRHM